MSSRMGELTKTERRAREAVDAMSNDDIWKLGDYSTSQSGGSIRITAASQFCDRHQMGPGEDVIAFMHSGSGALIILPENDD